jgi:CspA family cold shock protein
MKGKIRHWDADRGFGFIRPDDGGDDVFFHVSHVQGGTPEKGDRVTFDIATNSRTGKTEAVGVLLGG